MKFSVNIFGALILVLFYLQSYCQRNDHLFSIVDTCTYTPEVTPASRCGAGTLELSASSEGTGTVVNWYDAPGGNLLGAGTSFTTPSISATTTYYVQEVEQNAVQKVGPADSSLGAGSFYSNDLRWINFDVSVPVILVSVKVYSDSAGNRTIELVDANGTVLQQQTANVPLGESRVTLNFAIDPGNNYSLRLNGGARLYRSTGGISYPYVLNGVISLNSSNATSDPLGFYYFFYDWEVREKACISTIYVPVIAEIGSNISVNINSSGPANVCSNDSVVLNAGSGYASYEWSNGNTAQSMKVTQAGNYVVTVTDNQGCSGMDTIEVFDQGSFTAEVNVNGAMSLCNGDKVDLEAEAGMMSYQWSTGATTQSVEVSASGEYSVTVVKTAGCTGTSEGITINVSDSLMPFITAVGSVNFCEGDTIILEADNGYASYQWSTGSSAQTTKITEGGIYAVTVSDGKGCAGSASKSFSSSPRPQPEIVQNGSDLSVQGVNNIVSYEWYLNGDTIPGTNQATYTPTQNGNYTVAAVNFYGCVGFSDPYNYTSTGVHLLEKSLKVYPNPSEGIFNVSFSGLFSSDVLLEIYDATGNCILKKKEHSGQNLFQINLSDHPVGNYMIRFRAEGTEVLRHVVKL